MNWNDCWAVSILKRNNSVKRTICDLGKSPAILASRTLSSAHGVRGGNSQTDGSCCLGLHSLQKEGMCTVSFHPFKTLGFR